ncbi:hypothetical protein LWI29_005394 [Acer saccharum]|uniref:CCHC-type domain-containing protein n=2 Tax=Acer TaxID=4022 RepID=A0AA39W4R5_ACESA|nr:hypothetical protein LWI29_005394 [Acer saccharum]
MTTEKENSSFIQPAIPRFDGHYDHWAMLMENFLRSKEYWGLIENGIPAAAEGTEPTEAQRNTIADLKLKDLKVKNYLFQAIDRTIIETILNKETAKAIWDSMKLKYQGSTKVKRAQLQALRREFEILGIKEGEKVDEYFARILTIVNKMKAQGERMEQSVIIEKILRSMTLKFNYVVCSIEESNDLSTMTIDELQSSLLVHEQRMQGQKEEEHALKITNSEKVGGRNEYRVEGRGRARGSFRGGGRGRGRQSFNKALVECYKCHKLGHFQYECPSWEKNVNYVELNEDEEMLLMSSAEEVKRDVLEWGDENEVDNEDADANEVEEGLEDEQADQEMDNSSPNESSEEAPSSPNQGRNRRQPPWMRDYVTEQSTEKKVNTSYEQILMHYKANPHLSRIET